MIPINAAPTRMSCQSLDSKLDRENVKASAQKCNVFWNASAWDGGRGSGSGEGGLSAFIVMAGTTRMRTMDLFASSAISTIAIESGHKHP